jgi:uncharacterized protein with HEPN domain
MRDQRLYLEDLLERIQLIESYTQEGREAFMATPMMQDSVIRCYEIIGEIAKRLDSDLKAMHPTIPWKSIAGFRDVLIHNYNRINLDVVWDVVEHELQPLRLAVESMLKHLDDQTSE